MIYLEIKLIFLFYFNEHVKIYCELLIVDLKSTKFLKRTAVQVQIHCKDELRVVQLLEYSNYTTHMVPNHYASELGVVQLLEYSSDITHTVSSILIPFALGCSIGIGSCK